MAAPTGEFASRRLRLRVAGLGRGLAPVARRLRRSPAARAQLVAALAALLMAVPLLNSCSGMRTAPTPITGASSAPVGGSAPANQVAPASAAAPSTAPSRSPVPLVAAPTDGVLESAAAAARPVLAVMIDDAPAARPQSGLADADVLIQAPAEGGIPRYMALYQTQAAPEIGPIRSSRRYFVGWAAAWRPLYAHVGGAPNALDALQDMDGRLIWNADEFTWAAYMPRIATRIAPHNVYSSTRQLDALAARLGTPAAPPAAWSFVDPAPLAARPTGGSLVVPYPAGVISYTYDRASDRYLRSVDGSPEVDAGTGTRVAPYDVLVLFVAVGPLANAPGQATNEEKGRLEVGYIGRGRALVLRDGAVIDAQWSKASDAAPLLLTVADGPGAGAPATLVRGQVAIQVVPEGTAITLGPPASAAPTSRFGAPPD